MMHVGAHKAPLLLEDGAPLPAPHPPPLCPAAGSTLPGWAAVGAFGGWARHSQMGLWLPLSRGILSTPAVLK